MEIEVKNKLARALSKMKVSMKDRNRERSERSCRRVFADTDKDTGKDKKMTSFELRPSRGKKLIQIKKRTNKFLYLKINSSVNHNKTFYEVISTKVHLFFHNKLQLFDRFY